MSDSVLSRTSEPFLDDRWTWWQARRLKYNLALGAAGWTAYGLGLVLFYAAGQPIWRNWQGGLATTLFLGVIFLVLMGVANVCYLLGPFGEAAMKPADVPRYRCTAYAMGFWGSVALPFVFPVVSGCSLLGPWR